MELPQVHMRFGGQTYHAWPSSFNRRSEAEKFAKGLRKKDYKVRTVNHFGSYSLYTIPAIRKADW